MQIKDTCAVLCGLVVAQDYKRGQQLVTDRSFADNAHFFQVGGCWRTKQGNVHERDGMLTSSPDLSHHVHASIFNVCT